MTARKGDRAGDERLGQFSLFRQHAVVLDEHERHTLERRALIAAQFFFLISQLKPSTASLPTIGSPMGALPASRAVRRVLAPLAWERGLPPPTWWSSLRRDCLASSVL